MRRIPFTIVKGDKVEYVCPNCKRIIHRDIYIKWDKCPSCNSYLNKYARRIVQVYKMYDKDIMNFIDINRR